MSERSERIVSAEGTNPAAAKQRGLFIYKNQKENSVFFEHAFTSFTSSKNTHYY